jgi:hypothetical protein
MKLLVLKKLRHNEFGGLRGHRADIRRREEHSEHEAAAWSNAFPPSDGTGRKRRQFQELLFNSAIVISLKSRSAYSMHVKL